MKHLPLFAVLLFLLASCQSSDKQENTLLHLASPDEKLHLEFTFNQAGQPVYRLLHNGTPLIDSSLLGFVYLGDTAFDAAYSLINHKITSVDETWQPVWGEVKEIRNNYNQLTITIQEKKPPKRQLSVVFRLYNDGVGFRYQWPKQDGMDSLLIADEKTQFNLTGNHKAWWIPAHWDSYEMLYNHSPISHIPRIIQAGSYNGADELYLSDNKAPQDAVNTPITMLTKDDMYLSFHEAALSDYAGMTLKIVDTTNYIMEADLVPWPDKLKVRAALPHVSPWRTIQVGRSPGDLLESHLIVNLNDPNKLADVSWIKPMKYMGIWWGYHIGKYSWDPTPGKVHGASTENAKAYIDFASEHDIPALLIEGWCQTFSDSGAYDYTKPHPDFDFEAVTRYGREKNVVIIGHHETMGYALNYDKQLDSAFAYMAALGVPAVKTGYAWYIRHGGHYHHNQWMVNHYRKVLETAAKYKIMINVHEPIKPTGIRRTYPHMLTREGVRANEYNPWLKAQGNPPEHETILPFTRMLAGPIDFTPGIFDLTFERYRTPQRVNTTLAKQLALYVVLYSPLQMVADLPENYEGHPAFQFIKEVPVNWDNTKILSAEIGDYVAIARQQGENWYIGAITDENARELLLSLEFLTGDYIASIYSDSPETDLKTKPMAYSIKHYRVKPQTTLHLNLAESGGTAITLKPAKSFEGGLDTIPDYKP